MALKNKSSLYDLHSIFYILYDPTVNSVSNFRYHQTSTVALCLRLSPTNSSCQQSFFKKILRSASTRTPSAAPPAEPLAAPAAPAPPGWAFQELAAPHGRPRRRRPRRAPPPLAAAGHQTTAAGAARAPRTRSTWPSPRPPGTAASHPRFARWRTRRQRASRRPTAPRSPRRGRRITCAPSPSHSSSSHLTHSPSIRWPASVEMAKKCGQLWSA